MTRFPQLSRFTTLWKHDSAALFLVGVVAFLRVVAGWQLRDGTPPGGVTAFGVFPMEAWSFMWMLASMSCFLAVVLRWMRPVAVAVVTFAFTAWAVNWGLMFLELGETPVQVTTVEYLLMSSAVGNVMIVFLLIWGLGRGQAGEVDLPDGTIVDVHPPVDGGG